MKNEISTEMMKIIKKSQLDEEEGAVLYSFMAKRLRDSKNKHILENMANDEKEHAQVWQSITQEEVSPRHLKMFFLKLATYILGFTFVVKTMQKSENLSISEYEKLVDEIPQVAEVLADERRHEKALYGMLDEERLHYVGAMVLGLNDALVELTGAIAGVTFALANTRLVALTGIVTGVSATLSMAASNYLAERADGNKNAIKSSLYTGVAYLVTVILLVLPYLILPNDMYVIAFSVMIVTVLLIILFFNYYLSVVKDEPFFRRFSEMAVISLSVALLSFIIGLLSKSLLGIDTL